MDGYSADYPVLPELATLAADVLKRYHAEKNGEENVGRVLPAEYLYFTGDGRNNHFTIGWKDTETCDCRNTNNDGGEPKDKQKERKNDNDGN